MKRQRRYGTRQLDYDWPFPLSAVPGRGIVQNILVPRTRHRLKTRLRVRITKKE